MSLRLLAIIVFIGLLAMPHSIWALWARLTDAELVAQSEVIVMAELIGQTRVRLVTDQAPAWLGVLQIQKVLKGDPSQSVLLLVLPAPEGPRLSTDRFYQRGQRGLWFLRPRTAGDTGLYVADHPQRFLSATDAADRLEAIQKILKTQAHKP